MAKSVTMLDNNILRVCNECGGVEYTGGGV